ncbi:LysR family transcriptional regulator [Comamonas jiangduensis]|uniref:LysR family transcriptional regulator n=1 Tax=Comamonas jiangduensis TaxID=1194168 RepID=UPI0028AACF33|nr:LysR family transcriptional regulator [Comamonas jiangduensis]
MSVFVKAVECGSFASAADELNLSAPMVGKHVRQLEQQLGITLLNRSTRRQSLTDVGRHYYERCKIVLAEVDAADAIARESKKLAQGHLRISASINYGTHCLAPVLSAYRERHPHVTLGLELSDSVVDLIAEGYDAVFRVGTLQNSGLRARALAPYRMVICASPGYLAQHGTPRTPAELMGHECLRFTHWSPREVWYFDGPQGREEVEIQGALSANVGQALKEAALHGMGIILQPEVLVAADVKAGRLIPILPGYIAPSLPVHLLTAPGRLRTQKLQSFVDYVVQTLVDSDAGFTGGLPDQKIKGLDRKI